MQRVWFPDFMPGLNVTMLGDDIPRCMAQMLISGVRFLWVAAHGPR